MGPVHGNVFGAVRRHDVGGEHLGQGLCGLAEAQDVPGEFEFSTMETLRLRERGGGCRADVVPRDEGKPDIGIDGDEQPIRGHVGEVRRGPDEILLDVLPQT